MGKVTYSKLCKRLKFAYSTKLYVHKQESIEENETHEIINDFSIQTDPSPWSKNDRERKTKDWQLLASCHKIENAVIHQYYGEINCSCFRFVYGISTIISYLMSNQFSYI